MSRLRLYTGLLTVILLVCGAAWYLFRPEKAFLDDVVDEPFPAEVSAGSVPPGPSSANPPEPR